MPVSFARRERLALVTTARTVGPSAPTLCGDWTVLDLVCHLVLRERKPWAMAGAFVPPLAGVTERVSARLAGRPFETLLATVESPAPLVRWDAAERLVNTLEFFVHHEDIRRAQPGWTTRPLSRADEAQLWAAIKAMGRVLARPAGVPLVITDGRTTATLRGGDSPVTLSGPASELALFLFGRKQVESLEYDGPPTRVAALRSARLGF